MLVVGVALGATAYAVPAATSSAGKVREGGTFRIAMPIDFVDPALAYFGFSWLLLDATCAKLLNYPDLPSPAGLRPVPEVAQSYRVSNNGQTYAFFLRRDFRFSDGTKLDAHGFARQIARLLELKSDGLPYVQDIVGADDVIAGRASRPRGVVARGNRLVIRLRRPIPDFPARLAMPFFCAVPPGLPADPEGVKRFASAGPYYVADYVPGRRVVLLRNAHYRGSRPHHVRRFTVDVVPGSEVVDRVKSGAADWGFLGPRAVSDRGRELVQRYGRNRSRLFIRPSPQLGFFTLNTARPLFHDNARLRRAVNLAVDRHQLANAHGYLAARPTDQYLPIDFPGFRNAHVYPLRGNVRRAKALARGRLRGGKAVLYTVPVAYGIELAQLVQRKLARIGLDVEIKVFPVDSIEDRLSARREPFDLAWLPGFWAADYPDPYAFINLLLDGRRIGQRNWSRFDSRTFNRRMIAASRMRLGPARYAAYAKLDRALVQDAAPMLAYASGTSWTFVSNRLDPRCRILRPGLDLAAVCLKR